MLQRVKLSMVAGVVGLVVLFLSLQYLAAFKESVKTTQAYTLQMQTELRQAMEEQREALEEARQEDSHHLEAVLSEVEMKVALLLQSQAHTDNTVAQQLETVVQQLKSALAETDRVLSSTAVAVVDDSMVGDLAFSQEELISTIDLLIVSLEERKRDRERERGEREEAKRLAALPSSSPLPSPTPSPSASVEVEHCILDDADDHSLVDLDETLLTARPILSWKERSVEYDHNDAYIMPAEELFGGDEKLSMIFRLGFPSTSSSNLRKIIEKAAALTQSDDVSERLADCPMPTLVGCGGVEGSSGTKADAVSFFRKWAGQIFCPKDPGQHMGLAEKEHHVFNGLDKEDFNLDAMLRTTMLREPSQYANRVFGDRRNLDGTFSLEELESLMGIHSISGKYLFFDMSFEERTQCSLDKVTMTQWVNLAYWRWNYFVRGMASDYSQLWIRFVGRNPETREDAWEWNEQGQESPLLKQAIDTLHTFPFFGIYDRIELSMELFAFTFCVDYEALGFEFKTPGKALRSEEEHLMRGADVVGEETHLMMRDKNRLDFLFFEYAEKLFDERVEAMRKAKDRGYRCKLADSSCGLVC